MSARNIYCIAISILKKFSAAHKYYNLTEARYILQRMRALALRRTSNYCSGFLQNFKVCSFCWRY